jgi:hypothetical protein
MHILLGRNYFITWTTAVWLTYGTFCTFRLINSNTELLAPPQSRQTVFLIRSCFQPLLNWSTTTVYLLLLFEYWPADVLLLLDCSLTAVELLSMLLLNYIPTATNSCTAACPNAIKLLFKQRSKCCLLAVHMKFKCCSIDDGRCW